MVRAGSIWVALALAWAVSVPAIAGTFPASNKQAINAQTHRLKAAHFLSLATFGPSLADIDALAGRMDQIGANAAMEEWIDDQFALPATLHEPLALAMMSDDGVGPTVSGGNQNRYRDYAFFHTAIAAPDQLRQRMAWALIQIFVINQHGAGFGTATLDASGEPQNLGTLDYYDMLLGNAFGNYRQLVEDVTFHPIMGVFLSHVKNPKGNPAIGRFPDENYARELLQLFSIGLYELQQTGVFKRDNQGLQIETYDNESIKSFARVFTGLSYAGSTSFYGAARNYHEKMLMYEDYHDPDAKVLLRGESLPAGLPGVEDIGAALDNVFSHPNVPPFIARLLIQRFVKSNPSKGYIRRVANAFVNNGAGVRGDFEAVLKAILPNIRNFYASGDGSPPIGFLG